MPKDKINKPLLYIGLILTLILIPTVVGLIFNGSEIFSSWRSYFKSIYWGVSYGFAFWLGNWAIGVVSGRKLNWKKNPHRANIISLLLFIFYGMFASTAVPYIILKYKYHYEGSHLINNVFNNAFFAFSIDMIAISIYYSRYLVHYWKKYIEKGEELKKETLVAKYEALKSQVNPHFLFNSLNTLTGVVEHDQKKAVVFIKKLSDIYRYVLEQKDKELTNIQDELGFVENYIFLAKLRHGEGLNYKTTISSFDKMVLPLGLQILVENCIQHNIIEDDRPLNVEIYENDDYLVVKNNVQKKSSLRDNNGIGLDNLKKRYAYLSNLEVIVSETNDEFIVKIPLLENPQK